ncbi:YdcH family protein [Celeribacter sp.]|uniref:YdcH family protein n=1 Tax=Celeribacter sp. TaxID=1890673 RepID=UPI003A936AFD
MNMSTRMEQIEVLRVEIEVLKREHRDLDEAIHAMQAQGHLDALRLQRLKKQKLLLKDQIEVLYDRINPDIIA